jgi:predicted secreted Zn-dependent protease
MRAVFVAPEIPGFWQEMNAELPAHETQIATIAKTHGFDLAKVVAAIRSPGRDAGRIIDHL